MFVNKVVQLAVLAAAMMWETRTEAASTATVRLCGRKLSEIMSKVCVAYNDPTVVEQPTGSTRRKRQAGIADECCTNGCTWNQLTEYCAISTFSELPLAALEKHMIADRSAESSAGAAAPGGGSGAGSAAARREVGRRSRGYGRQRARRCWCRRKRRSGRRRASFMDNNKKRCRSRCARGGHRVSLADLGPNPQH